MAEARARWQGAQTHSPDLRLEGWSLIYDRYDPDDERTREALCALGNGYWVSRGADCTITAQDQAHYAGTYRVGLYDRLTSQVDGHRIWHEGIVNLPNWLPITFETPDGSVFNVRRAEILDYHQELDLYDGVLRRRLRLRDSQGRIVRLTEARLVCMETPHLAALQISLTPENWSGRVIVRSFIDASMRNANAATHSGMEGDHLDIFEMEADGQEYAAVQAHTVGSRINVCVGARTRLRGRGAGLQAVAAIKTEALVGVEHACDVTAGGELQVEKIAGLYTSRDMAWSEIGLDTRRCIGWAGDFDALLGAHTRSWQRLWQQYRVEVTGQPRTVTALRLQLFHILQTVSPHVASLDAGIPARGWTGESYRGHVFWDELFVLPVLSLRMPELTRSLLLYRYRRLPEARRAAREAGLRGAMFPWRCAGNGQDVTEPWRLNLRSGHWVEDNSGLQRHMGAAVVYNIWQYYQISGDAPFMSAYGAEIILDVAQFWSSIARLDHDRGRYVIRGVMGPDEFHDRYPGHEEPGIDNNAYTNIMAAWCLHRALDTLGILKSRQRAALLENLGIDAGELERWRDIARRMYVPLRADGLIDQFEGFERLRPLDWEAYRRRYGDIHRLDNILEAEGDSANNYQVCKQADVLMLFYLFSDAELSELLAGMGYRFDAPLHQRLVRHYLGLTSHGSTLSRVVHAWVLTRMDRSHSWHVLHEALGSDLADIQGGTTAEGIHLGAMGGVLDVFQRAYTGLEARSDALWLCPRLPDELPGLVLRLCYRGLWLDVEVDRRQVRVRADDEGSQKITLLVCGQRREIGPGSEATFTLDEAQATN